jgi:hypothetical protein
VTIDLNIETVEWNGGMEFPQASATIARGLSGTFKVFAPDVQTLALFSGGTKTTGSENVMEDEEDTIPGTPYEVTVDESATFVEDLGVYNVTNGEWMTKVASSPATGEYSVSAGVYTYAAADEGDLVRACYVYTSASGENLIVPNAVPIPSVEFELRAANNWNGNKHSIVCYRIIFKSLSPIYASKRDEDINEYAAAFAGLADYSGNAYKLSALPPAA